MIRNNKRWFSAAALVLLLAPVAGAGFFAPYDPIAQHRDTPLSPPTPIHFVDQAGRFHLCPFVCRMLTDTSGLGTREDCTQTSSIRLFVRTERILEQQTLNSSLHLFGTNSPNHIFLLGTDEYGRDQLSRLLYGGQISLGAGLLATALSLGLGLLAGCIAGYFGSWVDGMIMRTTELFMALPWIYLLLAVRAFLPLSLDSRQAFLLLIGIVGVSGWARPSRLIRGVVLSAKQRGYVLAARGFGVSTASIMRRHILPQVSSIALTQAALLVPQYILAEVTFSFLGLGMGEPQPSWGNMLAGLQNYYTLTAHWWMLASGLALVPVFLLLFSFANSLQRNFPELDPAR